MRRALAGSAGAVVLVGVVEPAEPAESAESAGTAGTAETGSGAGVGKLGSVDTCLLSGMNAILGQILGGGVKLPVNTWQD